MDNYKIKVKDEAESKEAQEFLFSLGYTWGTQSETKPIHLDKPFLYTNEAFIEFGESLSIFREAPEKELTIAELRVLATAKQPQAPALISGADVPALIKQGESVQFRSVFNVQGGGEWKDLDLERDEEEFSLGDLINTRFEWRLKPQTIKLELELPKPFEPKVGDIYWFLSPFYSTGYDHCTFTNDSADKLHVQYGAYRTEEEIKQVVEQLRKIRGAS